MPGDRTLLSLDASHAIPTRVLLFEDSGCVVAHRSDRCSSPVKPVPTSQTSLELLQHRLRFFSLGFVDQPRNLVIFW
jgi:hypothetical protein